MTASLPGFIYSPKARLFTSVISTVIRPRCASIILLISVLKCSISSARAEKQGDCRSDNDQLRLRDALVAGGERSGVIGVNVGSKLKRLPASVYWAGIDRSLSTRSMLMRRRCGPANEHRQGIMTMTTIARGER